MLVPADDNLASACQCSGKEIVIVGIFANRLLQNRRFVYLCMFENEVQDWREVNGGMFLPEDLSNPPILIQYFL